MTSLPTSPASSHHQVLSVTDTLLVTLRQYGRHILLLGPVAILPQVVAVVLLLVLGLTVLQSFVHLENIYQLFNLSNQYSIAAIALLVLVLLVEVWGVMALIHAVLQLSTTAPASTSVRSAFVQSLSAAPAFIGWGIVTICAIVTGYIIGFIPLFLLETVIGVFAHNSLSTVVGLLDQLLTVGAFITTIYIVFTSGILLDKKTTLFAALRESIRLVRGHFWPLTIRVVFGVGLLYVLGYLIQFIPWFSELATWVLLAPLSTIYIVVLYRDLQTLKH
jgi:hypothetical protein